MKYEPAIDRAALLVATRDGYGLRAGALTFIPVGYAAACYRLDCADGERFFLKLWPAAPGNWPHPTWRPDSLRLARALHERVHGLRVPYPLPARDGALWAVSPAGPFAVFPFLPGESPAALPPAHWDALARAVAAYHRATPALADVLPPREGFAIPFEAELRAGLERIARVGPGARPGLRALRDLVLPRRDEILAQLARLRRLGTIVRQTPGPVVLCHTDLGGDNLLVDEAGGLALLDWDEATLAPPEHDLWAAREGDLARFLAVYREAGGAGPLHLDRFAFALLRRHLGDMAVRLLAILDGDGSPEEDADALHGIDAWGFAEWRALDATLDRIAAALRDGSG
jgi:spectinomycin phosphotransferase